MSLPAACRACWEPVKIQAQQCHFAPQSHTALAHRAGASYGLRWLLVQTSGADWLFLSICCAGHRHRVAGAGHHGSSDGEAPSQCAGRALL